MAKHPKFDEVVDTILQKVPAAMRDREGIAENIEFALELGGGDLDEIIEQRPAIKALVGTVEVTDEADSAIRAAFANYGVSLLKLAPVYGLANESEAIKLVYYVAQKSPDENYDKQARTAYIYGNLCEGWDVLAG